MVDEKNLSAVQRKSLIQSGDDLEVHYNNLLRETGKEKGILVQIFTKSQNKITDPARLYKLITLINAEQWVLMGVKDKGHCLNHDFRIKG